MAWDRGYRVVECQSDSMNAVRLIESTPPSGHVFASLVWDIKDLLSRPWEVLLKHTLREGNACADFLTKHGADQQGDLVVVEEPPQDIALLLLADASGVASMRP
ncbi:uncharacterized protein LOC130725282 [Lotus japonicus]|uniref:uncharacterized protein LOC130725282 n=1 Tax=Lotus japonicus TaxID=34305 RepID=UPI00258C2946|nr:uncharacterized protein LOC130725282 [Lotus japonicus]